MVLSTPALGGAWAEIWDRYPVQADLIQITNGLPTRGDEHKYLWLRQILSHIESPLFHAELVKKDSHLPGGRRPYRKGWHQGIDLYPLQGWKNLEIHSAAEGLVIRSDLDYIELTVLERQKLLQGQPVEGPTVPEDLDVLHGRQVWLLHKGGVVTRYSHLSAVCPRIFRGQWLERGEIIGLMGNSGTDSAAKGGKAGVHLHFEIHTNQGPFWEGLNKNQAEKIIGEILKRQ